MPRLKVMSGHDVRALLVAHGFAHVRTKGSHMIMARTIIKPDGAKSTISIPVPNHKEVALGTLSSIAERSGLPRELFEVKN